MDLEIEKAIDKYYSLKNEYDTNNEKEKNKIKSIKGLSWKEKRREFVRLRPKCINCKRAVGTIFSTKIMDEDEDKHLLAICGDKTSPCLLNIDINLGNTGDIRTEIITYKNQINEYKKKVIIDKNNLIFGYITSEIAVDNFDKIKNDINIISSIYESLTYMLTFIKDDPVKIEFLEKNIVKLNLMIDEYKLMNKKFKDTKDGKFLQDIVDSYVNNLIPFTKPDGTVINNLLKTIMNKKYEYSAVEVNEIDDDNVNILVQKQFIIKNFEIDKGTDKIVISMKLGLEPEKKTSEKLPSSLFPSTTSSSRNLEEEEQEKPLFSNMKKIPDIKSTTTTTPTSTSISSSVDSDSNSDSETE